MQLLQVWACMWDLRIGGDGMTENKRFWYIMCYCDDEIEAEDKDEAYKIFCKKHNFNENDAEFISYSEVEND